MSDKAIKLSQAKTLYDDLRERVESVDNQVVVSDTEPQEVSNKLWIDTEEGQEYSIPTYAEFSQLSGAINVSQPTATSEDIGKFLKLKAIGQNGKPTEFEYGEGGVLPDDLPTDETAQELLEYEGYNTGLTDTALMVIGMLFDNLPRDETAIDILHSLELECERLELIYNGWIAERESV